MTPHCQCRVIPVLPKDNAKLLAAILAIESVKVALPRLKPLTPRELREFRAETAEHVKPDSGSGQYGFAVQIDRLAPARHL
jgi:hypothetical protein